ncbi:hypothetical protein XELAEV_18008482mg [Xenopus laevis]|uniref:Uncharacterized protein n=1 Tax=Xenopus laevis TaxID=8355 RepID=A0A974E3P8_XENLA|nr:hypothetical protein XELAEV_18008482mg [Xenopus laevis]
MFWAHYKLYPHTVLPKITNMATSSQLSDFSVFYLSELLELTMLIPQLLTAAPQLYLPTGLSSPYSNLFLCSRCLGVANVFPISYGMQSSLGRVFHTVMSVRDSVKGQTELYLRSSLGGHGVSRFTTIGVSLERAVILTHWGLRE